MLAGGYTLDLYCDNQEVTDHKYGEFPHQYVHELGSTCRRRARKDGWLIKPGRQLCPQCSGKKPANNGN